jgi:ATP-dependent Lon protease
MSSKKGSNKSDGSKKSDNIKIKTKKHKRDDDDDSIKTVTDTKRQKHDDDDDAKTEDDPLGIVWLMAGGHPKPKKSKQMSDLETRIRNSNMEPKVKESVLFRLQNMDADKQKQTEWFENLLKIPFKKYTSFPVCKTDPIEKIQNFIVNVESTLNKAVYGMEPVKEEIINYVTQHVSSGGDGAPRIIALCSKPGMGKTQLIKNGLAKAIDRPMRFISMGGITDSAHFVGFDYSYAGSRYGAIVQALIEAKVMNPIIFMDELDKISQTTDGKEVQNLLVHLTDPVQNSSFQDKYFAGIDIDLSKVIFVFSYNDEKLINPVLKDRIHTIYIPTPNHRAKVVITREYMLKEVCNNIGIDPNWITIDERTLSYMIDKFSRADKGMRSLKHALETLILKVNTGRYLGSRQKYKSLKMLENGLSDINKLVVTEKMIDEMIDKDPNKEIEDYILSSMFL